MQHRLTPQFILDRLAGGERAGSFDAACLFVDISGFTPLTVTLMAHGTEGAEVLAQVLVEVFEPLIDAVYGQGGFIAGFAGDAFKAVFPFDTGPDQQAVSVRALLAAWAIRAHLVDGSRQITRFGEFTFSGKVCVATGPVDWAIWQDASENDRCQQAASLFGGGGLAEAMAIDPHAGVGQVVITEALTVGLPDDALTTTPVDGYMLVEKLGTLHLQIAQSLDSPSSQSLSQPHAADFYPQWLLDSTLQGEFRQVVTMFVNFERDFDPAELADFQTTLFGLVDQYDGFLGRVGQIGGRDSGNTLLLFWGAPTGSEHDVERALGFVIDLQEASPVRLRTGVTTRMAYAGFVGSPLAEEYTCYGSYVNLAARQLIDSAWGEIWLDDETTRQAARRFQTERRGAFRFKGFSDPQPISVLLDRQAADPKTFYAGTLVGRQAETDRLNAGVLPIFTGDFAGIVAVEGEAGLGKSRLVHEYEMASGSKTPAPRWFLCQTDDILRRPLNPFRYWLHHYFGQSADASEQANRTAFDTILDDLCRSMPDTALAEALAEELKRSRSFLAALVDLHWAGSLYAQLEPQLRLENMLDALKTLVKAESLVQPVVVLLEDAHWLDDESRQFIDQLTRNVDGFPFVVVITQRPRDGTESLATEGVPYTRIQLSELGDEQVGPIVATLLGGPPSPALVALIAARANGNPFFVEQIALYLHEHGMLESSENGWQLTGNDSESESESEKQTLLPTDVRALLTARLDQLPPTVKEVVQTASVLGREFDTRVLSAMLDDPDNGQLTVQMDHAHRARIWSAMGEARYLFRHALLRDVAYDMQLRSQLRSLHRLAAGAVHAVYAGEPAPHYAELVHHYHLGEAANQERTYAELAGKYAADQYANEDALHFYSRAITLTPAGDLAMRSNLLLSRETVLDVLGAREEQQQDLDQLLKARSAVSFDRQVAIQLRHAEYQRNIGDYAGALEAVAQVLADMGSLDSVENRVKCNHLQGRILWQMGENTKAREPLQEGIRLATAADLYGYMPHCQYDMGATFHQEGQIRSARPFFLDAQQGFGEAGDLMGLARCTAMIGVLDNEAGDYLSAQQSYLECLEICESIGWRLGAAVCLGYLCNNFFALADYDAAGVYNLRALSLSKDLADQNGIANALDTDGLIQFIHGRQAEARLRCREALGLYQQMGDRRGQAYTKTHLGLIGIEENDLTSAEHYFSQANDLRIELGDAASQVDSLTGRARVHYRRGALDIAVSLVDKIAEHLENQGTDGIEFPFLAYATCIEILATVADRDPPESAELRARAVALQHAGRDELERRADAIDGIEKRRRFIRQGAFHQNLLRLFL